MSIGYAIGNFISKVLAVMFLCALGGGYVTYKFLERNPDIVSPCATEEVRARDAAEAEQKRLKNLEKGKKLIQENQK